MQSSKVYPNILKLFFAGMRYVTTQTRKKTVTPSSQGMPCKTLIQIYSISEVIILSNDQHQHQETISTNNRINSTIKQHTTFVDWCCCLREVLFQKVCLLVVYKFTLHGQQFSCQTGKGNRLKHRQFSQGVPVWRMYLILLLPLMPFLFFVIKMCAHQPHPPHWHTLRKLAVF